MYNIFYQINNLIRGKFSVVWSSVFNYFLGFLIFLYTANIIFSSNELSVVDVFLLNIFMSILNSYGMVVAQICVVLVGALIPIIVLNLGAIAYYTTNLLNSLINECLFSKSKSYLLKGYNRIMDYLFK